MNICFDSDCSQERYGSVRLSFNSKSFGEVDVCEEHMGALQLGELTVVIRFNRNGSVIRLED